MRSSKRCERKTIPIGDQGTYGHGYFALKRCVAMLCYARGLTVDRYVILKQERQAKEDDYEARIALLKRTAEELERQGEYLEKNGENLEKKREELERQQEGLEKQLGDSQEARARDLAQLSHIRDEKMSLERKLAKYPFLSSLHSIHTLMQLNLDDLMTIQGLVRKDEGMARK